MFKAVVFIQIHFSVLKSILNRAFFSLEKSSDDVHKAFKIGGIRGAAISPDIRIKIA